MQSRPPRKAPGKRESLPPRVSVISIFYNAERFFENAIESVLAQDFSNFELLLVDDGSGDSSSRIARDSAANDERIRYLHHPDHSNQGMSASRNLGIAEAKGEFIAFIDADDRWRPEKLGQQVEIFVAHPQVDAVFGAVNYWRSWDGGEDRVIRTGHAIDRPIPSPQAALRLYPLGDAAAPCPSDLMVRASVARDLGGFEESFTGALQMYEDQAFLAKLYLKSTVYFSGRTWIDYRIHDQSCVAQVRGEGGYPDVRRHFLIWLKAYLGDRPHGGDPRVRAAVDRALRIERLPAPVRKARRLARRVVSSLPS